MVNSSVDSRLDLSPAKWIWLPSQRTLACTFVLFRREIKLDRIPESAIGWIAADSRYRLTVNGQRVQWGPAPQDPRYAEADPVDLKPFLREGVNCIGVEVLYYGHGDGTWPFGKPGLLLALSLDEETVLTDQSWTCIVDRAHPPGQYARWFLRALQEDFDARRHPFGWDLPGFDDSHWLSAQELDTPPNRSAFSGRYSDYTREVWMSDPGSSTLIRRSIPMLGETWVDAERRFVDAVHWKRDPRDWFENRVPDSFTLLPTTTVPTDSAFAATYELPEAMVGWPGFTIDAPDGTVVELMIQESHDHLTTPWLDSHIYAWSRFTCREGVNRFETFDYEAGRWLQLHVHGHSREVAISEVGMRRRVFPWPNKPEIEVSDPALQRLFRAGINTLYNSAQETIVDGMGRERQQYSGDGSHQLHPIRYAFGETRLPARFLRTFAQGQLIDGVFSDSWPAVDRLQRIWERNVDASDWGPLIDHSIGFVFDHYHHWMQTGDTVPIIENWPRIVKFVNYLYDLADGGMVPVTNLGINAMWIDHNAFENQEAKRCATNLYVLAMVRHAFLPMLALFEEVPDQSLAGLRAVTKFLIPAEYPERRPAYKADSLGYAEYDRWANRIQESVNGTYWDERSGLYILQRELGNPRFRADDRSLATALIYDFCPNGYVESCVNALANRPKWLGQSYPANMVWNYWALAKAGRIQSVIDDLRDRWAPMRSVVEANALQEMWTTTPDSTNLMSHCPVAPLTALYQGIMGLWPTEPGFKRMSLRPQLGDIESLYLVAQTPEGPVRMVADPYHVRLTVPTSAIVELPTGNRYIYTGRTVEIPRSECRMHRRPE